MAKTRVTSRMVDENDPQWVRFWNAYPKRVSKKEARQRWAQINPTPAIVDRMIDALVWQCQQPAWTKDNGQFIPYPASWLNDERWQDEQPVALQKPRAAALSAEVG